MTLGIKQDRFFNMALNILTALFGTKHERDLKKLLPLLHQINEREEWAISIPTSDFPSITESFRTRIKNGENIDSILPEAFALSREAARRILGERPYDVQMLGGIVLHNGKIVEMKTGEGKTLSSVSAIYLNSLSGKGVHVVTVNDYLAERDSGWMGPVFNALGASVGVILSNMDPDARREAYAKDITYGTNNEFGFDYLRDNMTWNSENRVQRRHHFCVIDEIDSILIDEARTPLIISGPAEDDGFKINEANRFVPQLEEVKKDPDTGEYPKEEEGQVLEGDYKCDEKTKRISFTSQGLDKIEKLLQKRGLIKGSLFEEGNFEFVHYLTQAVRSHKMFHKDTDYVVQNGLVQIVDEFTGRILAGRRYSDGLHEAIEAKEHIRVARRNRTLATITFQNFFRMYEKIAGMTGTADTEAPEFAKIYNLDVIVIPTNRPLARTDNDDLVFLNENDKLDAIVKEISEIHKKGQPVLVGTVSIEKSEKISELLTKKGIRHEVLNAKNHAREALIIAEAGAKGSVTIATNMAGRGTDIKLGGNPEFRTMKLSGLEKNEDGFRQAYELELKSWRKDYEEVKSLGGLYVLGTERHESRRIDNQLRGRSGRQGDPGLSRFFISLDDELMRLFGGSNLKGLMSRMGMKNGEPIFHSMLNKTIEGAQKRVEERNFEIRKHLLEYDDVLNQQRTFIYNQRDSILKDQNLRERVLASALEMVEITLNQYDKLLNEDFENSYRDIQDTFRSDFGIQIPFHAESEDNGNPEFIKEYLNGQLLKDISNKSEFAGPENLNHFICHQYLQIIDQKWLNHLENMEALREAVYLRSYAQKNPLTEYKIEGFRIFEVMIEEIRATIARRVFQVKIKTREERQVRSLSSVTTSHNEISQFGKSSEASGFFQGNSSASTSSRTGTNLIDQARSAAVTIRRSTPKVGRNDPCPCGSGKKYKYCHGS